MRVLKNKKLSTTKAGSTGSGGSPAARRAVSPGKVQASKAKRARSTKGGSASGV
jgi:hypothetical protein